MATKSFSCRCLVIMTNTLINNNTTFNKTEDTCTSISIKMDGYLTNDITYKTIKVDTGEGISKFVTQNDIYYIP